MKNGGGFRLFKIDVGFDGELGGEVHLEGAGEMVGGGEGEVDLFAAQYFRDVSARDRCAPTPCTLFIKCVTTFRPHSHCTLFIKYVQPFSITTTIYTTTCYYSSAALPRTLFIKCVQRGAAELRGAWLVRGSSHAAER